MLAVWSVFFATLAIYPAVQLDVVPTQFKNPDSALSQMPGAGFLTKYWPDIMVFLLFNVMAMVGNFLAWFDWFVKLPCNRPNVYWYKILYSYIILCSSCTEQSPYTS